jgi:hypothetical protein
MRRLLVVIILGCGADAGDRGAPGAGETTAGATTSVATSVGVGSSDEGEGSSSEGGGSSEGSSSEGGGSSEASTGGVLACESGSMDLAYVVTPDATTTRIEMPLVAGKDYATLRLAVEYTVGPWREPCFNPATSQGTGFPAFESLLSVKRGDHWCKGGALFEMSLHGPGPGHGLDASASASTYFREEPWDGSGCGETEVEGEMFSGAHGHSEGGMYRSEVTLDFTQGVVDALIGEQTMSGGIPQGVFLRGPDEQPYVIALSWDGPELECYGESGVEEEGAPCCFGPSLGWTFSRVEWEAC